MKRITETTGNPPAAALVAAWQREPKPLRCSQPLTKVLPPSEILGADALSRLLQLGGSGVTGRSHV